jgi:hypothetical protein
VPVVARNAFQTLRFGHRIRRYVDRWANLVFLSGRDGELRDDIRSGPPPSTSARGRRLILFLIGGDRKSSRRQSRPLRFLAVSKRA